MFSLFRGVFRCSNFPKLSRTCSTENGGALKRIKLGKKVFSTILFGGTFGTAIYFHKKRKKAEQQIFNECTYLPRDENYNSNMRFCKYRGYIFPEMLLKTLPAVQGLQVSPDDIFVVSFPKTGTTWLQEIVYLIVNGLNFEEAKSRNLEQRFPFLEYFYPGVGSIQVQKPPRLVKTHLPYSLLPESIKDAKPKILYIYRNPKDVCVSLYHFVRSIKESSYVGSFADFFSSFANGNVAYGPFWKHYNEWMEHSEDPNVFLISYEELHRDPIGVIQRVAVFLERPLSEADAAVLAAHCNFHRMAANNATNYEHWRPLGFVHDTEAKFMRKGQVGDWRNFFSPEMSRKMDDLVGEYLPSFKFVYDLSKDESSS